MKTNNTNILSTILITGAIAGLILMSNVVLSSATLQSNNTDTTVATTNSSNELVIRHIDAAIMAIKSGDNDQGRLELLEAEKLLEGVESAVDSEKRIEAALKVLKDGDSNGSISQAEEAKKLIP
jgi:hypothetical protein